MSNPVPRALDAPRRRRLDPAPEPRPLAIALTPEQVERAITALERLADGVEPVAESVRIAADFTQRLEALCVFARRWAPRLLWLLPLMLTLANAVSPELGQALERIVVALAANVGGTG